MIRWLLLLVSSATITVGIALLGSILDLPLLGLPLLGIAIAGIMWWRWPWALGVISGGTAFAMLLFDFSLPIALLFGLIIALEGGLPAWVFAKSKQPYDLSLPSALVLFLGYGVVVNTLGAALLMTAVLVAFEHVALNRGIYVIALLWLIQALTSLQLTLPLLRFGTYRLRLNGMFATPAATQRGIARPDLTRKDCLALAAILSVLALGAWLVNLRMLISPQVISTLFLLPMIWFAIYRGFDGALFAGLSGSLVALAVTLGPSGMTAGIVSSITKQRDFATIIFELVVFYLASTVIGMLIDGQRAERRRLETLLDLNRMVAEITDQAPLLQRLAEAVQEAVAASTCLITRYDQQTEAIQPLAISTCVPLTPLLQAPMLATSYPAFRQVLTSGTAQLLHINDLNVHPSSSAFFTETGFITAMLVPLQRNQHIFGMVEVFDLRPERQFSADEVRLVEAMGSRGAGAMEQARLIQALRDHSEQLNAVADITSILNATLDLDVVCRDIARQIARVAPHELACVALFEAPTQSLRVVMSTESQWLAGGQVLALSDLLIADLTEATPQRLSITKIDQSWTAPLIDHGISEGLIVPLQREARLLGILLLGSSQPSAFPDQHQQLLQMLARHMALAISNARLYAELEQTYRAKQEAQDMLLQTERFRALGELASGVAHDFNNLLTGILGHTQLMLLEDGPSEGLEIIEQAARDGTQMVQRLQEFARTRRRAHIESVDINAIVRDVLQLARPRWNKRDHSIAITSQLELGNVPIVTGSAFELREVLINLIFNAVDAMPAGGTLTLKTGQENNGVTIEVRDTGTGMSEETQAHMWTPFFTTKGDNGTGLGLTMTHTIIVQHYGGRINVHSVEGQGTSMMVWLPLHEKAPAQTATPEPVEQRRARILVVENEPLVQSALTRLIETWGHQVTSVDSGQAALALTESADFDIAIVDISLTDITAWELMSIIKQHHPQTRTVLLTVWGTNIEPEQGAPFMDAVIPKPFEAATVRDTLAQLLAPTTILEE